MSNQSERTAPPGKQPNDTLAITYDGPPVRVDPTKITADLSVPDLREPSGSHSPHAQPGSVATALLYDAVAAGALLRPPSIKLDCYADSSVDAPGFVLAAYPDSPEVRVGVTAGWREMPHIALTTDRDDEGTSANDKQAIIRALDYLAREFNAMLGCPTDPVVIDPTA
jgi:hypothetical protein